MYKPLKNGDVDGARKSVSMIVGRDTESLDDIGITKAAVETVAKIRLTGYCTAWRRGNRRRCVGLRLQGD